MVLNRCLEDLEGRMRLKRTWRLVPEVEKKRNKWVEVSSDPGFWEFHQKGVDLFHTFTPPLTQDFW